MGLFSRRDKAPKTEAPTLSASQSKSSLTSGSSSIKSPGFSTSRILNRTSAATMSSNPGTPPFSPGLNPGVPRIDIPKPPDPQLDPVGYLRSLGAVRERCKIVTEKALRNELNHFDVDMHKFEDVVSFVANIIKRDYDAPFTSIPGHGRHQHFAIGGRDRIAHLLSTFPEDVDNTEKCKRMIDLFLVSVLLDAGAGTQWSYKSNENGRIYRRSEGIAVASLEMFKTGLFSGNKNNKYQVDKDGLASLTVEKLAQGLQSGPGNEMAGIEGRAHLLIRLGQALEEKTEFFGADGRPGNMLDHILDHPSTQATNGLIVPLPVLWNVLMSGLAPSNGVAPWESILPFHKLTQWLTYSLMQPMQSIMKIQFAGQELLTGLPEYRNGGLFIDLGVLTLKKEDMDRGLAHYTSYCERTGTKENEVAPMFEPSDDVIVEWRGVTVGFLDKLCVEVNKALEKELQGNELTLAQMLEAGSWKGGREIAEVSRPNTKEPPILIDSDGTVF
ncbi:unnamed protein product [Sordaria macrospora k-hell]|uniref:WGS project CABT00000000 data, contig 2.17 n=1 Tax=Sordaria macrospora (strain ATCC MYA-333 / DSM 997 / K(L3346) / K-hell) TaxID=771870 RepID=F7W0D4_SORMK|nr:uncharacterized protein SMAC_03939 [Sordaria macrospora k-hell]CCC11234.1 unnamed protein product [Sordaria macrospora k-hell]